MAHHCSVCRVGVLLLLLAVWHGVVCLDELMWYV